MSFVTREEVLRCLEANILGRMRAMLAQVGPAALQDMFQGLDASMRARVFGRVTRELSRRTGLGPTIDALVAALRDDFLRCLPEHPAQPRRRCVNYRLPAVER
jgi:hypothetical protein